MEKNILNVSNGDRPMCNVRLILNDKRYVIAFEITACIGHIKKHLSDLLEIDECSFELQYENGPTEVTSTLADFGASSDKLLVFIIKPKSSEEKNILSKLKDNLPTVDVITVHTREGEDLTKDLIVETIHQNPNKQWLGGFRNKITNKIYHNAEAQTLPRPKQVEKVFERDTQTPFPLVDDANNSCSNQVTQTYRPDLFCTSANDRIVSARCSPSSKSDFKKFDYIKALLLLQRNIRMWLYSKQIDRQKKMNKTIEAEIKKQKFQILKEEEISERINITGIAFPINRDAFNHLYVMLGNWWKGQWNRISTFSEEMKLSEGNRLLCNEIQLLRDIEKQRIKVKGELLRKAEIRFLQQISLPILCTNAEGELFSIDDLPTQRTREFKEIYSELARKDMSPNNRTKLLFTVKQQFLENFKEYEYAQDLISLLDREIFLLSIETKLKDLYALQERICQLYMYFMHQTEFNPKCMKYKEINTPKTMPILFQCTRCRKLLPVSKFEVHTRLTTYSVCTSCSWLKSIGTNQVDIGPYVKLLRNLRNKEMEKCCHQAICFILQPVGMCFLTSIIWRGKSAISECSDITRLQHVRWLADEEWSPWNTILLTNLEAKCHRSVKDVYDYYHPVFIEKVKQKHIRAHINFEPLMKINHDLCSSRVWDTVTDSGVFLHPSNITNFYSISE